MKVTGSLVLACAVVAAPLWAGEEPPGTDPGAPATAVARPAPVPPAGDPPASAIPPEATAPEAPPSAATPAEATPAEATPAEATPATVPPTGAVPSPAAPSPVEVAPDPTLPARTDVTIDRRNQVVAGIGFGGPLGGTFRLDLLHGLGADVREEKEHVTATCALPIQYCGGGFVLGAEAGSGGGKLSLGVGANARAQSDDFHGTVGVGLKASLARTWGSPVGTEPGLTYLGPEFDLYVLRFGVTLGVLWRVSGSGGSSALFTWGLGIRL